MSWKSFTQKVGKKVFSSLLMNINGVEVRPLWEGGLQGSFLPCLVLARRKAEIRLGTGQPIVACKVLRLDGDNFFCPPG